MTSERSQAYGRVSRTLAELGPAKLLDDELDCLRNVADTLLFSEEMDDDVRAALDDARGVIDHLIGSGRWTQERADQLADDLAACGPLAHVT
jgi:hypothetical protein